jgi:aarF domain-containing kinase
MMQTDPNWSNFLWNARTRQVELVDFGATRAYSKEFIDRWLHLLQAAAQEDREACVTWSLKLGYLTGEEDQVRCFFFGIIPPTDIIINGRRRS